MAAALITVIGLPDLPSVADAAERRIYYFHEDHLGSTSLVTDEHGDVLQRTAYTPFGATVVHTVGTGQPHQFTGQRLDTSTGLYYYNARYYDPQLGRFTQPDAFVQSPADPQTLNRYAYVRNNPENLVDPFGHFFQFLLAAVITVFAVATFVTAGASTVSLIASATGHENTARRAAGIAGSAAQVAFWSAVVLSAGTLGEAAGSIMVAAAVGGYANYADGVANDSRTTAVAFAAHGGAALLKFA